MKHVFKSILVLSSLLLLNSCGKKESNVNKLDEGGGKSRYLRPHEIEVVFAAQYDPDSDVLGKVQHLFSAGLITTLSVKLKDGQFVEVEVSIKALDEMGLDAGDEVAVRLKGN